MRELELVSVFIHIAFYCRKTAFQKKPQVGTCAHMSTRTAKAIFLFSRLRRKSRRLPLAMYSVTMQTGSSSEHTAYSLTRLECRHRFMIAASSWKAWRDIVPGRSDFTATSTSSFHLPDQFSLKSVLLNTWNQQCSHTMPNFAKIALADPLEELQLWPGNLPVFLRLFGSTWCLPGTIFCQHVAQPVSINCGATVGCNDSIFDLYSVLTSVEGDQLW